MAARPQAAAGKPPLSAHPAFAWIVALWFAALMGLGSFVLPTALIELMVGKIGLSAIVPAAAPPLGLTARAAIAALAAGAGAVIGFAIASRVRAAQTRSPDRAVAPRKPARASKPVLNAAQDLGYDGLDDPVGDQSPLDRAQPATDIVDEVAAFQKAASKPPIPGRRRALAMDEDTGPSAYLENVPLPGEGTWDVPANAQEDDALSLETDAAPLTLDAPIDDAHEPQDDTAITAPVPETPSFEENDTMSEDRSRPLDLHDFDDFADSDESAVQSFAAPSPEDDREDELAALRNDDDAPADRQVFRPAAGLSPMKPGDIDDEFEEDEAQDTEVSAIEDDAPEHERQVFGAASVHAVEETETPDDGAGEAPRPVDGDAPLDTLLDRLGAALADRRERDEATARATAEKLADAERRASEAQERASVEPDTATAQTDAPSAPRAFDMARLSALSHEDDDADEDEDESLDDLGLTLNLSPRQAAPEEPQVFAPAPAADETEDAHEDETEAEHAALAENAPADYDPDATAPFGPLGSAPFGQVPDESLLESGYSSLLNLSGSARPRKDEFVRIEEPEQEDGAIEPAVIFPNARAPIGRSALAANPASENEMAREADEEPRPATPSLVRREPADAAPVPRPFDPPASGGGNSDSQADADALRNALANLQRINGGG